MAKKEASPHAAMTAERQSQLVKKDGSYRKACTAWFSPGYTPDHADLWEAHHVACEHAIGGRDLKPEDREYIEQCLWITPWKLDHSSNLVGMPMKKQYMKSDGKMPINCPAHDVDHNGKGNYTEECKKWLKDNVWDTLKAGQDPHNVDPKDIKHMLRACTNWFKGILFGRGCRSGGTLIAWSTRFDPASASTWYEPFSMSASPRHRSPGVPGGALDNLFKKIKIK